MADSGNEEQALSAEEEVEEEGEAGASIAPTDNEA